jgi:hypothetical protein
MMDFMEYSAWQKKTTLPDSRTMLKQAGIDPDGPHEVEVLRFAKAMKKADALAPRAGRWWPKLLQFVVSD